MMLLNKINDTYTIYFAVLCGFLFLIKGHIHHVHSTQSSDGKPHCYFLHKPMQGSQHASVQRCKLSQGDTGSHCYCDCITSCSQMRQKGAAGKTIVRFTYRSEAQETICISDAADEAAAWCQIDEPRPPSPLLFLNVCNFLLICLMY